MEKITDLDEYKDNTNKKKALAYTKKIIIESLQVNMEKCLSEGNLEKGKLIENIYEMMKGEEYDNWSKHWHDSRS